MAPARGPRLGRVTLDEAVSITATGDIWLFRGKSIADRAIRAVTNSPVNHVGMAVAIDDLPPLLWHAELGRSLPDVWTGERQRGVQLHLLRDAVTTWNERYGQRAWVRTLDGTIERDHEDRLMEVIDPGRFWSGDRIELVAPFALGGEVAIEEPGDLLGPNPSNSPRDAV